MSNMPTISLENLMGGKKLRYDVIPLDSLVIPPHGRVEMEVEIKNEEGGIGQAIIYDADDKEVARGRFELKRRTKLRSMGRWLSSIFERAGSRLKASP